MKQMLENIIVWLFYTLPARKVGKDFVSCKINYDEYTKKENVCADRAQRIISRLGL